MRSKVHFCYSGSAVLGVGKVEFGYEVECSEVFVDAGAEASGSFSVDNLYRGYACHEGFVEEAVNFRDGFVYGLSQQIDAGFNLGNRWVYVFFTSCMNTSGCFGCWGIGTALREEAVFLVYGRPDDAAEDGYFLP